MADTQNPVQATTRLPQPGEGWRHYKGALYVIVAVGHDTRDGNALVLYREPTAGFVQHRPQHFARPLGEFLGFNQDHKPRFIFERVDAT